MKLFEFCPCVLGKFCKDILECGRYFATLEDLRKHYIEDHKWTLMCPAEGCDYAYTDSHSLKKHENSKHSVKNGKLSWLLWLYFRSGDKTKPIFGFVEWTKQNKQNVSVIRINVVSLIQSKHQFTYTSLWVCVSEYSSYKPFSKHSAYSVLFWWTRNNIIPCFRSLDRPCQNCFTETFKFHHYYPLCASYRVC